jgi:FkbM family methyltransferase
VSRAYHYVIINAPLAGVWTNKHGKGVALSVIYDFGANTGDNIPYYLLKAKRVIAVEANPILCDGMRSRFKSEISAGALVVENRVASKGVSSDSVPFYVHRTQHALSQFSHPNNLDDFDIIDLKASSASELVRTYGEPLYIKIDVEGYDHHILSDLFENGIHPQYLSAESQDIRVFAQLVTAGGYKAFKLVNGLSVSDVYKDHVIHTLDGSLVKFSFPINSAGPFGPDLKGDWMTPNNFFRFLAVEGLGWKDIHVSKVDRPHSEAPVALRPLIEKALMRKLRSVLGLPCVY